MHLQKLEIFGFKTFPDRTILHFSPGITCIVGPNGCGKSNIVDAILWVMGEQSAKSLRSGKMEDVIFYGSEDRKGLGMAEVTLTVGGLTGELSEPYKEYSQIEITRRLYRSGESEYLINRTPVRLKDIRDLLMDMGIGFRGHNVIEQGKIERLVTSTPDERRILIEDAAGIIKFKFRKAETLKKLEATRQNLTRIKDIIWEVKRQIRSLERQVQKAKEYESVLKKIREIEITLKGIEYKNLKKRLHHLLQRKEETVRHLMTIKTEINKHDSQLESLRESLLELERITRSLRDKYTSIEREIDKLEGRLSILENNVSHYRKEQERLGEEIKKWKMQKEELLQARESLKKDKENMDRQINLETDNLKRLERIFEEKSKDFHALQEKQELLRKEMFSTVGAISDIKNQYVSARTRLAELEKIFARIGREKEEYEKGLQYIDMKLSSLSASKLLKKHELSQDKQSLHNLQDRFDSIESELISLNKFLMRKREALHRKESRLSSLEEMARNYTGYEAGVRTIMLNKNDKNFSSIRGILAEFVEISPSCDPLVEKNISLFLNDLMQGLIVEEREEIGRLLDFLKSSKERATFILKSTDPDLQDMALPHIPGVVGPLTSFIQWDPPYESLIKALIGGVLVVKDLDTALLLWTQRYNHPIITLTGEVVYPDGRITGGSSDGYMTILGNKKELKLLGEEIGTLKREILEGETRMEMLEQEKDRIFREMEALKEKIQKVELDLDNFSREEDRLERERNEKTSYMNALLQEMEELKKDKEKLVSSIEASTRDITRLEKEQKRIEADLRALSSLQHMERQEWERVHKDVSDKKLKLNSLMERREALKGQILETERQIKATEGTIVQRAEMLEKIKEKEKGDLEEKKDIELILQELMDQKEGVYRDVIIHEERKKDMEEKISSIEDSIKKRRKVLEKVEEDLKNMEIEEKELSIKMDHIWKAIFDTYKCNIDEEVVKIDKDHDTTSLEEALNKLKERRDRMGPINMASIQEYEELSNRYEFLINQEKDLREACDTLNRTISRIDRTTKDLFLETFNRVNEKFNYLFKLFFQGGEGTLILTDESNLLETGVDIKVRPPGKRVHQLALLSGGEKALTSLALVFATFLARPAPFCILDEIDAPLDEPNTDRFIEVLNSMTGVSQFIIVTHNRRTMEAANMLYGVTMEEPGVSRVVAVDLTRREEFIRGEASSSVM